MIMIFTFFLDKSYSSVNCERGRWAAKKNKMSVEKIIKKSACTRFFSTKSVKLSLNIAIRINFILDADLDPGSALQILI